MVVIQLDQDPARWFLRCIKVGPVPLVPLVPRPTEDMVRNWIWNIPGCIPQFLRVKNIASYWIFFKVLSVSDLIWNLPRSMDELIIWAQSSSYPKYLGGLAIFVIEIWWNWSPQWMSQSSLGRLWGLGGFCASSLSAGCVAGLLAADHEVFSWSLSLKFG